jgi:hypothetical protein
VVNFFAQDLLPSTAIQAKLAPDRLKAISVHWTAKAWPDPIGPSHAPEKLAYSARSEGIVAKVERTAYLRLAVTFPDGLAGPRSSAGTLDVSDGQRIFRLLANGILFGKDKIVIRYSGPLPTNPSEEYWPRLCADRGRSASIRPRHIAWPFGTRRIGS